MEAVQVEGGMEGEVEEVMENLMVEVEEMEDLVTQLAQVEM